MRKLLNALTRRMPLRVIEVNGPYLERYYVGQLFGATFYLHHFVSSDEERHLHNHPWTWGRSLVLCGGYDEEVVHDLSADGPITETRRVRWWNVVNGNHFHRVARADVGTWTLFFHGPRATGKGWGFLEGREFVPASSASADWWKTAESRHDIQLRRHEHAAWLDATYGGLWYFDHESQRFIEIGGAHRRCGPDGRLTDER